MTMSVPEASGAERQGDYSCTLVGCCIALDGKIYVTRSGSLCSVVGISEENTMTVTYSNTV